jgi:hypothetical protein
VLSPFRKFALFGYMLRTVFYHCYEYDGRMLSSIALPEARERY